MLAIYLSMLDTEQERKKMTDLYEEHKYALLHYAMKIMRNQDMAEDAVHNAFISIIQKKEKYLNLDGMDFRRSAVIIVRHKCFDILRKQKPFADKSIEELEYFLSQRRCLLMSRLFLSLSMNLSASILIQLMR